MMTPKEVIKRVIEFDKAPRIGYDFQYGNYTDFYGLNLKMKQSPELSWQKPSFFADRFPQYEKFDGFMHLDEFGNLWGKMSHDLTGGGEVLVGALSSWDMLENYTMPDFDNPSRFAHLEEEADKNKDRFLSGWVMGFPFSFMRKMRKMENFLMDLILEKENVIILREKMTDMLAGVIENYGKLGADAIFFCEDWGVQDRLLISPALWREIFKPSFTRLCNAARKYDMKVMMHSCGYIYEILEDLMEVGINVFQLDQPSLMGLENLAEIIGKKATLYSSVDIQSVLPTGNKQLIEEHATKMVKLFHQNGGLIAKDYGDYRTINVSMESADWMREKFFELGKRP
ncbi:MAG: hypothetical protein JXQ23_06405 [Clostridia bacterium]|nr:hypothetical protein [Clostridia bacterium]